MNDLRRRRNPRPLRVFFNCRQLLLDGGQRLLVLFYTFFLFFCFRLLPFCHQLSDLFRCGIDLRFCFIKLEGQFLPFIVQCNDLIHQLRLREILHTQSFHNAVALVAQ